MRHALVPRDPDSADRHRGASRRGRTRWRCAAAGIATAALVACGGGDGGSTTTAAAPNTPNAPNAPTVPTTPLQWNAGTWDQVRWN